MTALTLYADGSLYGDADAIYGRIGAELATAQLQTVRQTGLQVSIRDEQLNKWEAIVATSPFPGGIGHDLYAPINAHIRATDPRYWSYRGHTYMAALGNGTIVRVRNGVDSDANDRQIWYQTITDPSQASQWTSWSVLYSGTHYGGPTVVSDGTASGYIVYHAKIDGIYRNNVLKWSPAPGYAILWSPVIGQPDAGWVGVLQTDAYDGRRVLDYWWTPNLTSTTPVFDQGVNYRQARPNHTAILLPDNRICRALGTALHFNPRDGDHGISQWITFQKSLSDVSSTLPHSFRGIGGGSGRNYVSGMNLAKLSDGFYYLFGTEVHVDQGFEGVTNLGYGMAIWMRSKDLLHWSEPVVGPGVQNTWGFNSTAEVNGYLYWADSNYVYRRPVADVVYDITNYVTGVEFELPRANQSGMGQLPIANPAGINDSIQSLSDREIIIKPGLKTNLGGYEFVQFDRFFIKQINRQIRGKVNRLQISFGNLWDRLDSPLRDVTNFVGRTSWNDWATGNRNKGFNYYGGEVTENTDGSMTSGGIILWTGWKGHNPDITASFSTVTGKATLIARYVDEDNYIFLQLDGTTLFLYERVAQVDSVIDSWSVGADSTPTLRLQLIFNAWRVWLNNEEQVHADQFIDIGFANSKPGYVGFNATKYTINNFTFTDYEADITMADLIKTALAMGDFHDAVVGGADDRAYSIIWGPQTDNDTPATALRTILETEKLDLTWRDGVVSVGQFNNQAVVRDIVDTVIESDQIDQAIRRVNLASVDGNEDFWLEVDVSDTIDRGRQIVGYYDLPELLDLDAVVRRAKEEIRRGAQGDSPGGTTPLYFDLWRMDGVNWVDNNGTAQIARIEGFKVEINQGSTPFQRQTFDTSLYPTDSNNGLIDQNGNPGQ